MKISDIINEATTQLSVEKDDDNATTLVDKSSGVKTVIDKKNPKSPKLAQDLKGNLSLTTPKPGAPAKPAPIKPGTPVTSQPASGTQQTGGMPKLQ